MRRRVAFAKNPWRTLRYLSKVTNPHRTPPILCPSIGRVGSTLLWEALIESRVTSLLGSFQKGDRRLAVAMAWTLKTARLKPGYVYKSHDLPHDFHPTGPCKVVFLFGRPSDVVLSVLRCQKTEGEAWVEDHLRHLKARGPIEEVLDRDVLRLEEQLETWLALRGVDIISLKYDALWDSLDVLSDFLGFGVTLPARRERSFSDLDPVVVEAVRARYADLDHKVAALPERQVVLEGAR